MRVVNDGDRRASNLATWVKSKPRMCKASVLRVSPYTNPLHRRMGRQRAQRRATVMRNRGAHFWTEVREEGAQSKRHGKHGATSRE